jgi:tetratricopeptide (TPR) repeat protein
MSGSDAQAALRACIAHHQAGRYAEAEAGYRAILAQFPQHPDALHMLGLLASHTGHHDIAAELIGQATRLAPQHPASHSNLGNALLALGRVDEAIESFRRALALKPGFPEAHNNLGNALKCAGRIDDAIACYDRALALQPDFAEAHNNLGLILADAGRFDDAIACYRRALAVRPDFADAHTNLGMALEAVGRADAAMASLQRALAIRPDYAEGHNNLGNSLKGRGRLEEAVRSYERALEIRPDYPEAHSNLGLTLAALGRIEAAISSFDRAIALRPDLAEAQWNKGITLLLKGDYAAGWPLYEWRQKAIAKRGALLHDFRESPWLGDTLIGGRTILLHHEQGLGDTLLALRYVPLLARQGARVVLQMPAVLAPVAAAVPGVSEVVVEGEPLPAFDFHCPMMSLPLAFRTRLETIPADVPYLFAPPAAATTWRQRLGPSARRRIGIAWSGSVSQMNDQRPVPLAQLLPVFGPDVELHSLQIAYQPADAALMRTDARISDHAAELRDLGETAALIAQLDRVVTIDTAVAHLAGGMGKPVWVMLPFAPDFRWLLERTDSPWYPTMRLFRQSSFGDWQPVLRAVAASL